MDTPSNIDIIIEDLNKRELRVAAFVCEDSDGKLSVLSYNDNGLLTFISDNPADAISINERLEGRMIRPMAEIGRKVKS